MVPFQRQRIKARQLSLVELGFRDWHTATSSGRWPVQFSYKFPKLRSFRASQAVVIILWEQFDKKQQVDLLPSPTKPSLLQAIINLSVGTLPFALSVNGKILRHDVIHIVPLPRLAAPAHNMTQIEDIGILSSYASTAEQLSVGNYPMVRFCFRDLVDATITTVLVEFTNDHVGTLHLSKWHGDRDIWRTETHLPIGNYLFRWKVVLATALAKNSNLPLATSGWDTVDSMRSSLLTRWKPLHVRDESEWNTDTIMRDDGKNVDSKVLESVNDSGFGYRTKIFHTERNSERYVVEQYEKCETESATYSHTYLGSIASEKIPSPTNSLSEENDSGDATPKVGEGLEYAKITNLESSSTEVGTAEFMVSNEKSDKPAPDIPVDEKDNEVNLTGHDYANHTEGVRPDNEEYVVTNPTADHKQESMIICDGEEAMLEIHLPEELQVRTSSTEDVGNQSEVNTEVIPCYTAMEETELVETPWSCHRQETCALVVVSDDVQYTSPSFAVTPRFSPTSHPSVVTTNTHEDIISYNIGTRNSQDYQEPSRPVQTSDSSSNGSTHINIINISVNINLTFATSGQEERPYEPSPDTSCSSASRATVPLPQVYRQENDHLSAKYVHRMPSLPSYGQLPLLYPLPSPESTASIDRDFPEPTSRQALQLSSDQSDFTTLDRILSSSDEDLQQQLPHLSLDTYSSTYDTNNSISHVPNLSLTSEPTFPTGQTPAKVHRHRRRSYRQYYRRRDRPGRSSPIGGCIHGNSSRDGLARGQSTNEAEKTSFTNSYRDSEQLDLSKTTERRKSLEPKLDSNRQLWIRPRLQFLSSRTKPSLTAVFGNNEIDPWKQTQSETNRLSRLRGPRPVSRFPMTFLPSLLTPDSSVDSQANDKKNTENYPPKYTTPVHWWKGGVFERIRQVAQQSRLSSLRNRKFFTDK